MGKRSGSKRKDKNKVILPPELPPEVDDDAVEVSDEDIEFYSRNEFHHFDQEHIDRLVSLGYGGAAPCLPIPRVSLLLHCFFFSD